MQLISKYNKRIRFLLCVIDLFSKCAWVIPIKNKKGVSIVNAFQKNLENSKRNQAKYGLINAEFYNSQFKNFLKDNNTEVYSTYNEEKSLVAERFIRTLNNKIYKHMTAVIYKHMTAL